MSTVIDEKLLLEIFRISSPSNKEDRTQLFIKSFLTENKIDFNSDKTGNIFKLNIPDAPLLSSHMDTVEDAKDGALMKYTRIYESKEYGRYLRGYGVIGGDDRCGVFIILSLLRKYPNKINFVFSVNEEHGMTGISAVMKEQAKHFDKILYGVVIDRRGAGDIICTDKNYGTKEFELELERIGADFGYKSASGAASDAGYINEKISCANISAGYYNPHSKKEFVIIDDMINAMNYTEALIVNLKTKFTAPVKKTYSAYDYNKRCKFCYQAESYYNKIDLIWCPSIKEFVCDECAPKVLALLQDKAFIDFASKKKAKVIPINNDTHYHEGD